MLALLLLLAASLAADLPPAASPPDPLNRDEPQLLVSGAPGHEIIWFEQGELAIRVDPVDGHVIDRQDVPSDTLGPYSVRTSASPPRDSTVGFGTGTFVTPRVGSWALASPEPGADLLLAGPDTLTRVHPNGLQESIRAPGIRSVAGFEGGVAYTHQRDPKSGRLEGLAIHGTDTACFLDGPDGPVVAPTRPGDPLIVRSEEQLILVDPECQVIAALSTRSRAATLTADALWVLTERALLRYGRKGDDFLSPATVVVAAMHANGGGPGPVVARRPAVEAPVPADAGLADDPMARAAATRGTGERPAATGSGLPVLERDNAGRVHRIAEHGRVPGSDRPGSGTAQRPPAPSPGVTERQPAGATIDPVGPVSANPNPLDALRSRGAWPDTSEKAVDVTVKRRSLPPGRSVAGITGVLFAGNPVSLPLRPNRPVLVVIGTDGQLPERLLATASDPAVDVLWALGGEDSDVGPSMRGSVTPGLVALTEEHAPEQTVQFGDFESELAAHLDLPVPGAMLVDASGRVLAEGDIDTVAEAMRWRNLDDVRIPRPTAAEWRYVAPEPVREVVALTADGVALRTDWTIAVLDGDGRRRWDRMIFARRIDVAGSSVLVSDGQAVHALSAADGGERWKADGSVIAAGGTWALVADHSRRHMISAATGQDLVELRALERPASNGGNSDVLWFSGPEAWRCGVTPLGAPVRCAEGDRVGSTRVRLQEGTLSASNEDGRTLWSLPAADVRIVGTVVLACLGTRSGPWVEIDARGRITAVLMTDAVADTNAAPVGQRRIYGTDDGAVVAWKAK